MITGAVAATEKLAVSREKIRQALMPATELTDDASGAARATVLALLRPCAQSNPFALVAGAFIAGGLLASNRLSITALADVLVKEAVPRFAPALVAALKR